jgi:hypothetical protein
MTVEAANYINQLDSDLPTSTDYRHEGDNHIRLIKKAIKQTLKSGNKQYDLDLLTARVIPVGAIIMWSGAIADIPAGWKLCNGGNFIRSDTGEVQQAPNLQNRFVVGAGDSYAPGESGGDNFSTGATTSAGAHTHTISGTATSAGAHNHGGSTGAPSATNTLTEGDAVFGATSAHTHTISTSGAHQHSLVGSAASAGAHTHNITLNVRPAYYALAYLIKT